MSCNLTVMHVHVQCINLGMFRVWWHIHTWPQQTVHWYKWSRHKKSVWQWWDWWRHLLAMPMKRFDGEYKMKCSPWQFRHCHCCSLVLSWRGRTLLRLWHWHAKEHIDISQWVSVCTTNVNHKISHYYRFLVWQEDTCCKEYLVKRNKCELC